MRDRVQAFIAGCLEATPPAGAVERAALELCAWQRRHNPAYDAFAAGAVPQGIGDIPALPVPLFRSVPLCCGDPARATLHFHTSGTTTGAPGVHRLVDSTTYDLASAGWFHAWLPDAPAACVSLIPSPADAPRSSLSHMVGLLYPRAQWLPRRGLTDPAAAWAALSHWEQPVFVASTALALASLLEAPGACELPPGSMLMTTGGFKGRQVSVEPAELMTEAHARMGGQLRIVAEYGMTELCSQLWSRPWHPDSGEPAPSRGPFRPPPWLVPVVVDPGTGAPVAAGETGQLRFVDLANDHSVLAIETMDQGSLLPDGSLLLDGRLPGAAARGCSLSVEEALRAAREGR